MGHGKVEVSPRYGYNWLSVMKWIPMTTVQIIKNHYRTFLIISSSVKTMCWGKESLCGTWFWNATRRMPLVEQQLPTLQLYFIPKSNTAYWCMHNITFNSIVTIHNTWSYIQTNITHIKNKIKNHKISHCQMKSLNIAKGYSGAVNRKRTHGFTPVVSGVRVARPLVFCVFFCRSLFVLFL
jgi:hypothetical protein